MTDLRAIRADYDSSTIVVYQAYDDRIATPAIKHQRCSVPDRRHGDCVDDNARGLLVALRSERVTRSAETQRLITTYLSYLHHSQREDGHFHNFRLARSPSCWGIPEEQTGGAPIYEDLGRSRVRGSSVK